MVIQDPEAGMSMGQVTEVVSELLEKKSKRESGLTWGWRGMENMLILFQEA